VENCDLVKSDSLPLGGFFAFFQSPPTSRWRPLPAGHWTTARWSTRAARMASGWTPAAAGHVAARHVNEL